jgi:wobble nucleotide-excising tRNase
VGNEVIEEIKIFGEASYSHDGAMLSSLKAINFIFGTNGSGKTTISRVIGNPSAHASCTVTWRKGQQIDCLVYNSDFVKKNFVPQLRGIFTLGETETDILARIETAQAMVKDLEDGIVQLQASLGATDNSSGKRAELRTLRLEIEAECWKIKLKHDAHFKEAFSGLRNSQSRFCDKVLAELTANTSTLVAIDDLKRKAVTLFEQGLERILALPIVDLSELLAIENEPILRKKIVGKDDVDVAALIRRLGNSDWVRQGLPYLDEGKQCPFCQQQVEIELGIRLSAYFDETYLKDLADITKVQEAHAIHAGAALARLEEISASGSRYIDAVKMRSDVDRLAARIEANKRLIERKRKEPSAPVALESLSEIIDKILVHISEANGKIAAHNIMVDNRLLQLRQRAGSMIMPPFAAHLMFPKEDERPVISIAEVTEFGT